MMDIALNFDGLSIAELNALDKKIHKQINQIRKLARNYRYTEPVIEYHIDNDLLVHKISKYLNCTLDISRFIFEKLKEESKVLYEIDYSQVYTYSSCGKHSLFVASDSKNNKSILCSSCGFLYLSNSVKISMLGNHFIDI